MPAQPDDDFVDQELETGGDSSVLPDVFLDVPVVKVDEINLEVEDLRARVSLQAEVLDLLKVNVGADVMLGRVKLDIKGVEAQATLKVRLDNVRDILDRVLTTIDQNPQIVERITRSLESTAQSVGDGAGRAVGELGRGAGEAAGELGKGAGEAAGELGQSAGQAVGELGQSAGQAVEAVGDTTQDVADTAGRAVEGVESTAEDAVEGAGVDDAVDDLEGAAEETTGHTVDTSPRRGRDSGRGRERRKPARRPGSSTRDNVRTKVRKSDRS
ncbi:MAG: hypothetical protein ACRDTQ_09900 [Micromonosporaceae bacterium]